MCIGSGSAGRAATSQANDTRKREEERRAAVESGKFNIDSAFEQFDPAYYDTIKSAYTGHFNPQLDKQYGDARGSIVAALAGRGILESTVGIGKTADLHSDYLRERAGVANRGQDSANALRADVENRKTSLYALNEAAADPAALGARAAGEASSIAAPASYSPLGQVFASALTPFANFQNARANASGAPYSSPIGAVGSGSGKVIR